MCCRVVELLELRDIGCVALVRLHHTNVGDRTHARDDRGADRGDAHAAPPARSRAMATIAASNVAVRYDSRAANVPCHTGCAFVPRLAIDARIAYATLV